MFNGWNTRAKREIEAKASVSRMVFLIYALGSSVKGLECHKWLELLSEKEIKLPDIRILSSGRYEKYCGLNCSLGGSGHLNYFSTEK